MWCEFSEFVLLLCSQKALLFSVCHRLASVLLLEFLGPMWADYVKCCFTLTMLTARRAQRQESLWKIAQERRLLVEKGQQEMQMALLRDVQPSVSSLR